jgi:transglutaminase-like putative cysteine protease
VNLHAQQGVLSPRNTFWLLGAFILAAAPHALRVPGWLTLLVLLLVAWRVYLARMRLPLPSRLLMLVTVFAGAASVYLHYGTLFGRDAGVALLIVMLTLKLLEVKSVRDGMLLIFLGYFLVITNFLYSQTIPAALYMLISVWLITSGMVGLQFASSPRSNFVQLRTAGALLLQSLPLMLVLFVLFPRVQAPLWALPADGQRSSTGLSDTMTPGSITHLTLSEDVAFRVTFTSKMPPVRELYWRGPVLWQYDGRTWHAPRPRYAAPSFEARHSPVEYTVTLEPHGKSWLFAIDLPGMLPPDSVATSDLQMLSGKPVTTRRRYDMVSFLDHRYGATESRLELEAALELPPSSNPRTLARAKALRDRYRNDRELIAAVLRHFNEDDYSYTLSPPRLGQHSVDEFLFETKSGFCEHYASAFAVIMRAAGIPARVVTGYLGGEVNPIGDYLIVRQAEAHAWNEVWLPGEGWIRVDPTAAVAPARIERGITAAVADGNVLPLLMRDDYAVIRGLRLTWDSLANTWNQRILGYTPERQRALLTRVGVDDATWRTLAALLLGVTTAVTLVLAVVTLRRVRARVRDPVLLAYAAFCRKLRDRGIARAAQEGPVSYAERVSRTRPDLAPRVRRFIALYISLRYAGMRKADKVAELQQLAREFRP